MPILVIQQESAEQQEFALTESEHIVGRVGDPFFGKLFFDDTRASRRHARIYRVENEHFIEDLGSRNGTIVNGKKVSEPQKLFYGDRLLIGSTELVFMLTEAEIETASSTRDSALFSSKIVESSAQSQLVSTATILETHSSATWANQAERKLRALIQLLENLSASTDAQTIFQNLLDGLFKIFPQADRGFVGIQNSLGKVEPQWVKHRNASDDEVVLSQTLLTHVMDNCEGTLSTDLPTDERFALSQSLNLADIRSVLCVPLVDREQQAVGVIQLDSLGRMPFEKEDLEVLAAVAPQASMTLQYLKMHQQELSQQALEMDLRMAHRVQEALLPDHLPNVPGYEFYEHYNSAFQVGGDFYDFVTLADGRLAIVVADVAGKGVSAAILVAKLSSDLRHCLASTEGPDVAIAKLNNQITQAEIAGRFITLVVAVLHPTTHEVEIVNAGHPAPLLRTSSGKVIEVGDKEREMALGILEERIYPIAKITLEPGDSLTLFTDGFTEAENSAMELYGTDRIKERLSQPAKNVQQLDENLISSVLQFAGNHPQNDDRCLVSIWRCE